MKISNTIRKSSVFAAACGLMLTAATSQADTLSKSQAKFTGTKVHISKELTSFDQFLRESMVVDRLGSFSGISVCSIPQKSAEGVVCADARALMEMNPRESQRIENHLVSVAQKWASDNAFDVFKKRHGQISMIERDEFLERLMTAEVKLGCTDRGAASTGVFLANPPMPGTKGPVVADCDRDGSNGVIARTMSRLRDGWKNSAYSRVAHEVLSTSKKEQAAQSRQETSTTLFLSKVEESQIDNAVRERHGLNSRLKNDPREGTNHGQDDLDAGNTGGSGHSYNPKTKSTGDVVKEIAGKVWGLIVENTVGIDYYLNNYSTDHDAPGVRGCGEEGVIRKQDIFEAMAKGELTLDPEDVGGFEDNIFMEAHINPSAVSDRYLNCGPLVDNADDDSAGSNAGSARTAMGTPADDLKINAMVIGSCELGGEEEDCGTGEGDGKTGGNGPDSGGHDGDLSNDGSYNNEMVNPGFVDTFNVIHIVANTAAVN